jgi:hypothetical protein
MQTNQRIQDMVEEVREQYPDVDFPTARREPMWYGRRNRRLVGDKVGIIVDYKGEEHLSYVASNEYKIAQYEEIIWNTEKAMAKLEEYGKPTVDINVFQDGGKFLCKMTFNECDPIEIREGQTIKPNITIKSSHDGMWAPETNAGAFVLVCSNGLTVGKVAYHNKQKHLIGTLSISQIAENLHKDMLAFADETGIWKRWADRQLTAPEWADVQEKLPFGKRQLPEVLALPMDGVGYSLSQSMESGAMPNLWDVYMASTQYLRDVDSDMVRVNKTEQVTNLLHRV